MTNGCRLLKTLWLSLPLIAAASMSPPASAQAPSFGSQEINDQIFAVNLPIAPLTLPQATGGSGAISYTLQPALPGGLLFNMNTGVLSGTPFAAQAAVSYIYTAVDASDATANPSLSFTLAVVPWIAANLDRQNNRTVSPFPPAYCPFQTGAHSSGYILHHVTLNSPPASARVSICNVGDGGNPDSNRCSPLSLSDTVMAGGHSSFTPAGRFILSPSTTYFVRFSAPPGSDEARGTSAPHHTSFDGWSITRRTLVYDASEWKSDNRRVLLYGIAATPTPLVPTFLGQTVADQAYPPGVEITPLTLPEAIGGTGAISYTLQPALPAGLSFDMGTRVLSGEPDTATAATAYTYTAMDAADATADASLSFRIAVVPFSFGGRTIADQTYPPGVEIMPLTLPQAVSGSGAISYTLQPALPAGLSFDMDARVLSGAPTTAMAAAAYTYTAVDAADGTANPSLSFRIAVVPFGFGAQTIADMSYPVNVPITPPSLPQATAGVGAISYTLQPALPAGLSFDMGTRVLSGTPLTAEAAVTYTYTAVDASDATANPSLIFRITITPPAPGGSLTVSPSGGDRVIGEALTLSGATVPSGAGGATVVYDWWRSTDNSTLEPSDLQVASDSAVYTVANGDGGYWLFGRARLQSGGAFTRDADAAVVMLRVFPPAAPGTLTFTGLPQVGNPGLQAVLSGGVARPGHNAIIGYHHGPGYDFGVDLDTLPFLGFSAKPSAAAVTFFCCRGNVSGNPLAVASSHVGFFVYARLRYGGPNGLETRAVDAPVAAITGARVLTDANPTVNAISGAPVVGKRLSANVAGGIPRNHELVYQWYRHSDAADTNGTAIDGANEATFLLKAAELGKRFSVTVRYRLVDGVQNQTAEVRSPLSREVVPLGFTTASIAAQNYMFTVPITPLILPAADGSGIISYTLQPALPAGLSFDANARVLSGTPAAAGDYTFTYTATDAVPSSVSLIFTITVRWPSLGGNLVVSPSGGDRLIGEALTLSGVTVPANIGNAGIVYDWWRSTDDGTLESSDLRVADDSATWTVTDDDGGYWLFGRARLQLGDAFTPDAQATALRFRVFPPAATGTLTFAGVPRAGHTMQAVLSGGIARAGHNAVLGYHRSPDYDFAADIDTLPFVGWVARPSAAAVTFPCCRGANNPFESIRRLQPVDTGNFIYARIRYGAPNGLETRAVDSPVAAISSARVLTNANPTVNAIGGTLITGETLTANVTGSIPARHERAYQWYRHNSTADTGGTAVAGANALTYLLTAADVGKHISVTARYRLTDGVQNQTAEVRSPLTAVSVIAPLSFDGASIAAQTWTVGAAVAVTLPAASGGRAPKNYTLMPQLPGGLQFLPGSRVLLGTPPAAAAAAAYTYTVTDSRTPARSLSLTFMLEVSGVAMATVLITGFDAGDVDPANPAVRLITGAGPSLTASLVGGQPRPAWQWYRGVNSDGTGGAAISGATLNIYTLAAGDYGLRIGAGATAGGSEVRAQVPVGVRPPQPGGGNWRVTPSRFLPPSLQDNKNLEWFVSAQFGPVPPGNFERVYYWERTADNPGANDAVWERVKTDPARHYNLQNKDAGYAFRSYGVWRHRTTRITSPPSNPIGGNAGGRRTLSLAPAAPVISGQARVGGTLMATVAAAPVNHTTLLQWYRDVAADGSGGTPISGATNAAYTVTMDDAGRELAVAAQYRVQDVGSRNANDTTAATRSMIAAGGPFMFTGAMIDDLTFHTTAVVNLTLPRAVGGTGIKNYTLAPSLPAGLTFTPATRVLAGVPTAVMAAADFTYTAADSAATPQRLAQTFTLTVAAGTALSFAEVIAEQVFSEGAAMVVTLPAASGGAGRVSYGLAPSLPAGLIFSADARTISGAPHGPVQPAVFTYTATDEAVTPNRASLSFTLRVQLFAAGSAVVSNREQAVTLDTNRCVGRCASGGNGYQALALDFRTGSNAGNGFEVSRVVIAFDQASGAASDFVIKIVETSNGRRVPRADGTCCAADLVLLGGGPVPTAAGNYIFVPGAGGARLADNGNYSLLLDASNTAAPGARKAYNLRGTESDAEDDVSSSDWSIAHRFRYLRFVSGSSTWFTSDDSMGLFSVEAQPIELGFPPGTAIPDLTFTALTPVRQVILPQANGANLPLTHMFSPALPEVVAGLGFDTRTRAFTGAPAAAVAPVALTYIVRDRLGLEDRLVFKFEVAERPRFAHRTIAGMTFTYTAGGAITPLRLPAASGGALPLSYKVEPLPAGLSLNQDSLVLSGTPSAPSALAELAYRVNDRNGATDALMFSVRVAQALRLTPRTIDGMTYNYTADRTIVPLMLPPASGGVAPVEYTLGPRLPAGLNFDRRSRVLSGKPLPLPAAAPDVLTYRLIYAARDGNGAEDALALAVRIVRGVRFAPRTIDGTAYTYTAGAAITPLTLPAAIGGAGALTYTLTPAGALPAGLSFDAAGRVLSGTPASVSSVALTYTVGDGDGSQDMQAFNLRVVAAPRLTPRTIDGTTLNYTAATAITPLTLPAAADGAAPLNYSLSPTLPAGLTFDESGFVVSGTVGMSLSMTFVWSVSDRNNVRDALTYTLAAAAPVSFGVQTIADQEYTQQQVVAVTLPAATGGSGRLNYTLSTPSYAGLSFVAATRVLSGTAMLESTATAVALLQIYRATDTNGSVAALTFRLDVDYPLAIPRPSKVAITYSGTGFVTGAGRTLTANIETRIRSVNTEYRWYRGVDDNGIGGTPITGATGATYTTTTDDFGWRIGLRARHAHSTHHFRSLYVLAEVPVGVRPPQPGGGNWLSPRDVGETSNFFPPGLEGNVRYLSWFGSAQFGPFPPGNFEQVYYWERTAEVLPADPNEAVWERVQTAVGGLRYDLKDEDAGYSFRSNGVFRHRVTGITSPPSPPHYGNPIGRRVLGLPPAAPVISGQLRVGETLSAAVAAAPVNHETLLQWYRDVAADGSGGSLISGETNAAYTVTMDDVDTALAVTARYRLTQETARMTAVARSMPVTGPYMFAGAVMDDLTFTATVAVNLTLPRAVGGAGSESYTLTPALPAGLSFDAVTGVLSGVPATVAAPTRYTYMVADGNARSFMSFTMTVEANTTVRFAMDAAIDDEVFTEGDPITTLVLPPAAGGTGAVSYSVTPSLPGGLIFSAGARTISGTPFSPLPQTVFTYTAADSADPANQASLTFALQVNLRPFAAGNTGVSNRGQPVAADPAKCVGRCRGGGANYQALALEFMTGANGGRGFDLSRVVISFAEASGAPFGFDIKVFGRRADGQPIPFNRPRTIDGTGLAENLSFSGGGQVPTAAGGYAFVPQASGARMTDDTRYFLILDTSGSVAPGNAYNLRGTAADAEDAISGPGWTISHNYLYYAQGWSTTTGSAVLFSVEARPVPLAFAADAAIPGMSFTAGAPATPQVLPVATGLNPQLTYTLSPVLHEAVEGLTFNPQTRTVSGTPAAALAAPVAMTYTVRDRTGLEESLAFNLSVAPAVRFDEREIAGTALTYMAGAVITPLTLPPASGGVPPLDYTLQPQLPAGLSFNQDSRVLSGTPTSATSAVAMTYGVRDRNGSEDALTFSLEVLQVLRFVSREIEGTTSTYTAAVEITPLTLPAAVDGVEPLTYTLTPAEALPAGLTFDADNRVLSGTPASASPAVALTYTATDANDAQDMLVFGLRVVAPLQLMPGTVDGATFTYTEAVPITPLTLPATTGGAGPLSSNLSPGLPAGLNFSAGARTIAGTPRSPLPQTVFAYTVTDMADTPNQVSLSFALRVGQTPFAAGNTGVSNREQPVTADPAKCVGRCRGGNNAYQALAMEFTTGANDGRGFDLSRVVVSFAAASGAASGLVVKFLGRANSGQPAVEGRPLTIDGSGGALDLVLSGGGQVPTAAGDYDFVPQASGVRLADNTRYFLVLDANNVAAPGNARKAYNLRGTAADATDAISGADWSIAHNYRHIPHGPHSWDTAADSAALFSVEVRPVPLKFPPSAMTPDRVFTANAAVALTLPQAGGLNPPFSYTLSPALHETVEGLTFNSETRAISGTPAAAMAAVALTYTVRDRVGSEDSRVFNLSVAEAVRFAHRAIAGITLTYTAGKAVMRTLPPASDGVPPLAYTLSPALHEAVEGLTFNADAQMRVISGTPEAALAEPAALTYTVRDTNGSEDMLVFSLNVVEPPRLMPRTIDGTTYTWTAGVAIMPPALPAAVGGIEPLSYTLTPAEALPAGLDFDADSRMLSGTAATASSVVALTYAVRDSDASEDMLVFNIRVVAPPRLTPREDVDGMTYTWTAAAAVMPLTLPAAVDGAAPLSYSLSPALPAGLAFDESGFVVSGTAGAPTTVTYVWRVSDRNNARDALTYTVVTAAAVSFGEQAIGDQIFVLGEAKAVTLPVATGGVGDLSYTLNRALPAGLTFDGGKRVLSGTPTTSTAMLSPYIYRAADINGSVAGLTFRLRVRDESLLTQQPASVAIAHPGGGGFVTGTGRTLTADIDPDTAPSGLNIEYLWYREVDANGLGGTAIMAATDVTYTTTADDLGWRIGLQARYVSGERVSIYVPASSPVEVRPPAPTTRGNWRSLADAGESGDENPPSLRGNRRLEWLTGPSNTPSPFGPVQAGNFEREYYWERTDDDASAGGAVWERVSTATVTHYELKDGDAGYAFRSYGVWRHRVTGITSPPSQPALGEPEGRRVLGLAPAAPVISGEVRIDETLSAMVAAAPLNHETVLQWYRDVAADGGGGDAISGETGASYTVVMDDVGKPLAVAAQYRLQEVVGTYPNRVTAATRSMPTRPLFIFSGAMIDDLTFFTAIAVNRTLPEALGGAGDKSYTLEPAAALPAGLSFTPSTRVLAGAPTTAMEATDFTYTAVDGAATPQRIAQVFTMTVEASPALSFAMDAVIADQVLTEGVSIAVLTLPQALGGAGVARSYTLMPALPAGLVFSASADGGTIGGAPRDPAPQTAFTYTATDEAVTPNRASLSFALRVRQTPFAANNTGVSNREQPLAADSAKCVGRCGSGNSYQLLALEFMTGANGGRGFDLSRVVISFAGATGAASGFAVKFFGRADNGQPDSGRSPQQIDASGAAEALALSGGGQVPAAAGNYAFVPQAGGVRLADNTSYFLILDAADSPGTAYNLRGTAADAEDAISGSGWSIAHSYRTRAGTSSWNVSAGSAVLFSVEVQRVPLAFAADTVIANLLFTAGAAVPPLTLPEASGLNPPLTYTLSPALHEAVAGLTFNADAQMRVISGTPAAALAEPAALTYTVRDQRGLERSLMFNLSVAAAARFADRAIAGTTLIYTAGAPIAPRILPAASGGVPPLSYALEPSLPADLNFNPVSRELSGTPAEMSAPAALTYSVRDKNGSEDTLVFSLSVVLTPRFTLRTIDGATVTYTAGTEIVPLTLPAASGGVPPLAYTLPPAEALPAGLAFDENRVLSGTPSSVSPVVALTYTVSDGDDAEDMLVFSLRVVAPPRLMPRTIDGTTLNYTMGTEIVPLTLPAADDGAPPLSYTLSPDLPASLTFDEAARVVSGMAGMPASVTYVWSVSDRNNARDALTYTVVTAAAVSFGDQTIADQNYTVGRAAAVTLPAATGGVRPLNYTLTPAASLPEGVTFDDTGRVLSGTPASTTSVVLTYTASDENGSQAALTFSFAVAEAVRFADRAIAGMTFTYTARKEIKPLTLPSASGGVPPLDYTLAPPLPAGLSFNPSGRVLSGTPTSTISVALTYGVRDDNGSEDTLAFSVNVVEPPRFTERTIDGTTYTWTAGVAITPPALPAAVGGIEPLTYTLTPAEALPEGLAFDGDSRVLSGTASSVSSVVALTYTVRDRDSEDMLAFNIRVVAPPRLMASMIDGATFTYTVRRMIAPLTLPAADDGAAPLSYSLSPDLPAGLTFDESGFVQSGTPETPTSATHVWSVSDNNNARDALTYTVIVAAAVTFERPFENQEYIVNQLVAVTLPAATGGAEPLNYTLVPAAALPAGLTFNDTTRVLSGMPTSATPDPLLLTYTAIDRNGSQATLPFTLKVIGDIRLRLRVFLEGPLQ